MWNLFFWGMEGGRLLGVFFLTYCTISRTSLFVKISHCSPPVTLLISFSFHLHSILIKLHCFTHVTLFKMSLICHDKRGFHESVKKEINKQIKINVPKFKYLQYSYGTTLTDLICVLPTVGTFPAFSHG